MSDTSQVPPPGLPDRATLASGVYRAPVTNELVGSAAVILAGSISAVLGSLVVRLVLARRLEPSQVGAILWGIAVVSMSGGIASLGLRAASAHRVAELLALEGGEDGARRAGHTAVLAAGAAGILTSLTLAAAARWSGSPLTAEQRPVLLALAPAAAAIALGVTCWGIAQGHHDSGGRALVRDLGGSIARLLGVGLAFGLGAGVVGVATGWSLGTCVGELVFAAYLLRRGWVGLRGGSDRDWDRVLLRRLPPFFGNTILNQTRTWLDLLLLGSIASLSTVGLYGIAQSLGRVLALVLDAAAHRLLPALTAAAASGDESALSSLARSGRDLGFALLWPALAPCALAPATVLATVFGAAYADGASALRWLAVGILVASFCGYTDELLMARHRMHLVLGVGVLATLVAALALVLLVPRFGAAGAAAAMTCGTILRSAMGLALLGPGIRAALLAPGSWTGIATGVAPAVLVAGLANRFEILSGVALLAALTLAALPPALGPLRELWRLRAPHRNG